ncbi:type VI secretion system lipoprotein TssJ [Paraburkholderia sediminicola]|uniref:type VI secretion system lipoprotein TssJ n=1 Tax=Paraburkholderia sediminicola TaxID=458836 RepID=UPI0038B7E93E
MKDSTVDAAKWGFTTQVKTVNMDLASRSSLNENGAGQSLSTVVRIYQLKTPQAFQQLGYTQLQTNDLDALKADLLVTKDVVLRPDASANISEPMNSDAEYVGVVAFFRDAGKDFGLEAGGAEKAVEADRPGEDRGAGQHTDTGRRRTAVDQAGGAAAERAEFPETEIGGYHGIRHAGWRGAET